VAAEGVMPLYQKCAHLGCRVPFCASSKWFECPCHGSKYNGAGEYQLGPAPRGMDRFKIVMNAGNITVDTSAVVLGPPRGTNTISQPPQGSFCVAPG
jgi:cytochrome b6-f complex iron-sulfur subunit